MEEQQQEPFARWGTPLCLMGLALVLLTLYWPAASLQGVFYVGDIFRLNYPLRVAYAQGLQSGRIPLWTADALGGYPILADGETGAGYPLNLLLYRWLPLPAALNYSLLVSFWLAGAGVFLYLRTLGSRRGGAFLGGCTFMLGGFLPGHLNHVSMLAAVAWLPLLLWAVERATRRQRWQAWALVAAIFGLQGLAGHPQVSLLSALLAGAQALVGPLAAPRAPFALGRPVGQAALCAAALVAGAVLAMVQWAPTYELMRLSQRGRGLNLDFFTSFSLPPADLVALLWPYRHGNPFPTVSQEMVGYVGALPLVLAVLAPLRRRDRVVAFWGVVAILAVSLAIGRFNPAYQNLRYVPLLNGFRAPARYLLWLDLAIAVLAGLSANSLLALTRERQGGRRLWLPALALPLAALAAYQLCRMPLDRLLVSWRWLPVAWLAATAALIVALLRRPPTSLWLPLAIGLLLADLAAFTGVQNQTYNDVMPPAEFARVPETVHFLQADAGPGLYRIYTPENWPGLPVMRESLYANIQMLHGVQSLSGYFPLVPTAQEWLQEHLNPRLLDLLNVRYVLVPQQLPAAGPAWFFATENPFARSLAGRSFTFPAQRVAALEAEGFLILPADLPDGMPVAEVILRGEGGEETIWTLRLGKELASWSAPPGDSAPVTVRTWPARFAQTSADGLGRTYLARYELPQPLTVECIEVRALVPQASLRLERLRLIDPAGGERLLADLAGEGDHVLVYCSPGVAIYRNETAGPRAFLVHSARVARSEDEARQQLSAPAFDPHGEAILQTGSELSVPASPGEDVTVEAYEQEYVRLRATTGSPAYLVLADSFYPGWTARLDGRPAAVERADVALRAVFLPPGEHVVEFSFRPASWRLGQVVSAVGWLALAVVGLESLRRAIA